MIEKLRPMPYNIRRNIRIIEFRRYDYGNKILYLP